MKSDIHPNMHTVTSHCTGCGNEFETKSTNKEIRVALCSKCHPFYTGEQRFVDTAGRVEKFKQKYKQFSENRSKKTEDK